MTEQEALGKEDPMMALVQSLMDQNARLTEALVTVLSTT